MIHWHHLAYVAAFICGAVGLLGYFGASMASRKVTSEDLAFPNKAMALAAFFVAITFI